MKQQSDTTKWYKLFLLATFLTLASLSWGQTCPAGGTARNNWCPGQTYSDPNCRSGPPYSGTNSCTGYNNDEHQGYNIGYWAYDSAGSSGVNYPNSITAAYIDSSSIQNEAATFDVVPNTAAGTDEYMEFANSYVQAFNKSTGEPIFVNGNTFPVTYYPTPANGAWGPQQICNGNNLNIDWNISFDKLNKKWVLTGMAFNMGSNNNITAGALCIAVSTTDGLLQQDSQHCNFSGGYCSFWSTYGFNITTLLPSFEDNQVYYDDRPDYARFGTFVDGDYYVTFDVLDDEPGTNNGIIHGFVACQIDGQTVRSGSILTSISTNPLTCYERLDPNWTDSGEGFAKIHTLLPADMQTSATPSSTNGEYFLATVSPFVDGAPCVPTAPNQPCTSNQLAFWTWSNIQNRTTPYNVTTQESFIPGCYYTTGVTRPYGNTICVEQYGTSHEVDSVGDRLMGPLAYTYVSPCDDGSSFRPSCEYLAVTQTIQEDQNFNTNGNGYESTATGVRYYTMTAPTGSSTEPSILYEGDFYDTVNVPPQLYYWMPSNAIDASQNVAYTFNIGNFQPPSCPISCQANVYADTITPAGVVGTLSAVATGEGSITDTSNTSWGEYVSLTVDPDGEHFWGVGEYLTSDEANCDENYTSGCVWASAIFECENGSCVSP
jgi:hypothetical protein